MASYEIRTNPNAKSELERMSDQEAYIADDGSVYFPGDEGYVPNPDAQLLEEAEPAGSPLEDMADVPNEDSSDVVQQGEAVPEDKQG